MRARAGSSLHLRSAQHTIAAIALAALAVVVALRGIGSPDPDATLPGLLVAALCALGAWSCFNQAESYELGAEAERSVGKILERNVPDGFKLTHSVPKRGGGDLDHVLRSRRLTIVVETKRSRVDRGAIAQAHRHRDHAERRWHRPAIAVVCLARGDVAPYRSGEVWVLSQQYLPGWLRDVSGGQRRRWVR